MPKVCVVEIEATASHNLMSTNWQGSTDNLLSCKIEIQHSTETPKGDCLCHESCHEIQRQQKCAHSFDSRRVGSCQDVVYPEFPMMVKEPRGLQDTTDAAQSFCRWEENLVLWWTILERGRTIWNQTPNTCTFCPQKHPLTMLVVRAEIKRKLWIPKDKSLVRYLIHQYTLCKRFEGAPFDSHSPPPLPKCHVKEKPAFWYIVHWCGLCRTTCHLYKPVN